MVQWYGEKRESDGMTRAEIHRAIAEQCRVSTCERDRIVARCVSLAVFADPRTSPAEAACALALLLSGERTPVGETLSNERLTAAWAGQL